MRSHQLLRAIRIDKLATTALETVILLYLNKQAKNEVPAWKMMEIPAEEIGRRAKALAERINSGGVSAETKPGLSVVGGGSLPDESLPTHVLAVKPEISLEDFSLRLRTGTPPVIGRIEDECFLFDLRTVFPDQEEVLLQKILENARPASC